MPSKGIDLSVGKPINKGLSFEAECAALLELHGWEVSMTKASGDQGADILASTGNVTVAIQCKNRLEPAGNRSVQEAISGKYYYGTKFSAVISTNGYTNAAIELAERSGVFLLVPAGIKKLKDEIGSNSGGEIAKNVFKENGPYSKLHKIRCSSEAQAEIFRAAQLVSGQTSTRVGAIEFLSVLDQNTFFGSGVIATADFFFLLFLANAAFTTVFPKTEKNIIYLRNSEDLSVRKLAELKKPFEYWRLLGKNAKSVQEEFRMYVVSCFEVEFALLGENGSPWSSIINCEFLERKIT